MLLVPTKSDGAHGLGTMMQRIPVYWCGRDLGPGRGCKAERNLKMEKHDQAITTARSPQSAHQLRTLGLAVCCDGGMIRSRVLRDPSFFFIIWPNR
jgi:hypothetical protein